MSSLLYDWNEKDRRGPILRKRPELLDETLRDGLQSHAVRDPPLDDKRALLRLMARLGIDAVDLGLPGAGPRAKDFSGLAEKVCLAGGERPARITAPAAETSASRRRRRRRVHRRRK